MKQEITDEGSAHVPPDPESLIPSQRARRQRIVVAALELLERSTYEKIQMRDIAEAANVALGTVYRYFASKEHLFAAVLLEWSERMSERVQRRPLRGTAPAEKLDDIMSRVLNSFERWPQFFVALTIVESASEPHAQELYARFGDRSNETFREALEGLPPETAQVVTQVADAMLTTLLRAWTRDVISMAEVRRRMSRAIGVIFSASPTAAGVADA